LQIEISLVSFRWQVLFSCSKNGLVACYLSNTYIEAGEDGSLFVFKIVGEAGKLGGITDLGMVGSSPFYYVINMEALLYLFFIPSHYL